MAAKVSINIYSTLHNWKIAIICESITYSKSQQSKYFLTGEENTSLIMMNFYTYRSLHAVLFKLCFKNSCPLLRDKQFIIYDIQLMLQSLNSSTQFIVCVLQISLKNFSPPLGCTQLNICYQLLF